MIGSKCQFYAKAIGVTLDDILRDEIRPNMTLNNQSFTVKMSAALTMLFLVAGLINSILSLITFKSKELRKMGCGIYLLASSITSIVTISMFAIKFWFLILTEMDTSIRPSILKGGCLSIESLLKLFLYCDGWLNACVAIERTILVAKGVNFRKEKSKRIAPWVILALPFCIMASIIHEPVNRKLFQLEREEDDDLTELRAWCINLYSPFIQNYNTAILLFHLVAPFVVNLFSAVFIIFRTARQRSAARTEHTYTEHIYEQLREHKQLIISPVILLVLSLPRLIIIFLPGCFDTSRYPWLFLSGYLISFVPSMLVFVVFVLPSDLYRKTFNEWLNSFERRVNQ